MDRVKSVLRLMLVGSMLIISAGASAPRDTETRACARGEVRLRKLHLVRPDLIPYPVAYEVIC